MKRLFLLLTLLPTLVNAQLAEYYYKDTENKEGGRIFAHLKYNNTILVAGRSFDKAKYKPCIMRVDTLGNVLWNTANNDVTTYTANSNLVRVEQIIMGMDGFIYASCRDYGVPRSELWKVNPANGAIVWKKNFNLPANGDIPDHMVDLDSTRFIAAYRRSSPNYDTWIALINKATGDTLYNRKFSNTNNRFAVGTDPQKYIYITKNDSVFKLSGANPGNVLWKTKYPGANAKDYQKIHYDTATAAVYFLGIKNSTWEPGVIAKVDPVSGNLINQYDVLNMSATCQDIKSYNGHLYITWRHMYVGGGTMLYWVTKYNMATGTSPWDINYDFVGVGSPASHSGGGESAMSLDVDNAGDVYLTGYYGDANYGPENWGVLKLNGSTGAPIYEKTITDDPAVYDDMSVGMGACVLNNKPYFVGDIETSYIAGVGYTKIGFAKLDPATGNTLIKKYIGGNYQFPSKTLFMGNYPSGQQTVVMKQAGRKVIVEMYDFYKTLLWSKEFSTTYYLMGANMAVAPNGTIYFSASSRSESGTPPYYTANTDSVQVFVLNGSGTILKRYGVPIGQANAFPVELHADNVSGMVFYQKSNLVYYRKVTTATISNEYTSPLQYAPLPALTKYCYNKNGTQALLFGRSSGSTRMMDLNKITMAVTNLSVIPPVLYNINYVLETDSNRVVICGNDISNRECMGVYNTVVMDTLWTKILANPPGQVLKCVTNPQKNYIYSVSQHNSDLMVRKIRAQNGAQVWSYTYNGSAGLSDAPADISYDDLRSRLLITGYETTGTTKNVLILVLDTAGTALDTIVKTGAFAGDNLGICTHVLPNGTQWVGGNRNTNADGLAGFIFEIDSSLLLTDVPVLNDQTADNNILIYPNPSTGVFVIAIRPGGEQSQVEIMNVLGETIYSLIPSFPHSLISSLPHSLIDLSFAPTGVYFIHIKTTNGSSIYKIIKK